MSKLAPTSTKYLIRASIKAKGVIEKPDVIGAVFGQTEGLLGSDLDLRELQKTGRIGRIEVNIKSSRGKSEGEIVIPTSLDSSETALIAATLETIERVGPCEAEITLVGVEDMRSDKRKFVVEKAQEILKTLVDKGVPDSDEISEQIKEAVRAHEVSSYKGLVCGPGVRDADNIIIVEGRADVLNLLKFGIKNAIAIEGTSLPPQIVGLTREKTSVLFVDGDRGGKLIAKELMQVAEIDYVAVAPEGKEVEELTKKEAFKSLREKVTAEEFVSGTVRKRISRALSAKEADKGLEKAEEAIEKDIDDADVLLATIPRNPDKGPGERTGFRERRDEGDRPRSGFRGRRDEGRRGFRERPRGGFRERRDEGDRPRSGFRERFPRERESRGERFPSRPPSGRGPREGFRGRGRFDDDRPSRPERLSSEHREAFAKMLGELVGTRAAYILDSHNHIMGKVPVRELEHVLGTMDDAHAVVFDGRVDMKLNAAARKSSVKFLVGMEKEDFHSSIRILDRKDLEK
jgi:DNA primase